MDLINLDTPSDDPNNLYQIANVTHEVVAETTNVQYDYIFKVITIGDSATGKSSMLKRLTENKFIEGQVTIGVEFHSFTCKVNDKYVKLQIWDTAGEENFSSVTKIFYRNSHAVILCYPINSLKSFQNVPKWLGEVKNQCSEDVLVFLSGNKADLQAQRQVSEEIVREY